MKGKWLASCHPLPFGLIAGIWFIESWNSPPMRLFCPVMDIHAYALFTWSKSHPYRLAGLLRTTVLVANYQSPAILTARPRVRDGIVGPLILLRVC